MTQNVGPGRCQKTSKSGHTEDCKGSFDRRELRKVSKKSLFYGNSEKVLKQRFFHVFPSWDKTVKMVLERETLLGFMSKLR